MKNRRRYISLVISFIFLSYILQAQSWIRKADFGGGVRQYSSYFAVNGKGYIGFGNNNQVDDLWEYDPATDKWTQKSPVPGGAGRAEAVAFVIGNKAYVGLGLLTGVGTSSEFWEYDPAIDKWTQVASYPGTWTRGPSVFSIGTKGYVASGSTYAECWEYDAPTDKWSRKADIPTAAQRYYGVGFAVGNKGYMGTGVVGSTAQKDFWEYDPVADSWTRKADVGGGIRVNAVSFASTTRGYIGTGGNNLGGSLGDLQEYDPALDKWTAKANYPGGGAFAGAGFAIGCSCYMGVGYSAQDFWQLTVCTSQPLKAAVSPTNDSCYGDHKGKATANPTGGTTPYTYYWVPGGQTSQAITGLGAGNYKLIVTDKVQAKDSVSFTITQPAPVDVHASADTTVCSGNPVLLSATGGLSYIWRPDTGLTDSTSANITAVPPASTKYIVTGFAANGCKGLDTVQVTVNILQPPLEVTAADTLICANDSTQICTTTGYTSYLWNTGANTACFQVKSAGAYWLTVTDANGCSAVSNHQNISVYPVPSVSLVVQGDTFWSYNAVAYQWYKDGFLISNATSAIYIAHEDGSYSVAVTDSNGCQAISNPINYTGINDIGEESIQLYPNPSSVGFWQLAVGNSLVGSKLEVFDDNGRLVFDSSIINNHLSIAFGAAHGVYLLRISSPKANVIRKLIRL